VALVVADRTSVGSKERGRVGLGAVARSVKGHNPARTIADSRTGVGVRESKVRRAREAPNSIDKPRSGVAGAIARRPATKRRAKPNAGAQPSSGTPIARGWGRVSRADYYDFRLFRGGARILDLWPKSNRASIPARWSYGGERYRLSPGRYKWFVYPGFGVQDQLRLGKMQAHGIIVVRSR
jgi:hypothetical protein